MNSKYNEILQRVAESTFESLAFILPMPDNEGAGWPTVAVSVGFSGHFSGLLFLKVSDGILPELATNMLGLEDEQSGPSHEQQNDALKELANVICGNFLPEIAGTEAEFAVNAPEIIDDGEIPEATDRYRPVASVQLNLDSGNAELSFFAEEAINTKGIIAA